MALLNTHATIKKFMQHGFSEEHAEVIVDTINEQSDQLATKSDLTVLKNELKTDISLLKSDIVNLEIRLESKIDSLESKIDYEVKTINANFKWMMAIGVLIVGILLKREIGL